MNKQQARRLEYLADNLKSVIEKHSASFDMHNFFSDRLTKYLPHDLLSEKPYERGSACGCIIGWSAVVFKDDVKKSGFPTWNQLVEDLFGIEETFSRQTVYSWLFDSDWKEVDNTVDGAILRIRWLLEHGLPEDSYLQMVGKEPLCYRSK